MRSRIERTGLICLCLVFCVTAFGQTTMDAADKVTDPMRSNDKIYVVMAVCVTILAGLFAYLLRLESKIKKAEKNKHL
jgi:hypothetical protein